MNKPSVKKNYLYNVLLQLVSAIIPIITTPYLSRVLGPEGIGIASYSESVVSCYVIIASFGIATYGQREIAYRQESIVERSEAFWNIKVLQLITSGITIVIYLCATYSSSLRHVYWILLLNLLSVILDITWFYQGLEEFVIVVRRNLCIKLLNTVFIFIFVKSKSDLLVYIFGMSLFLFLGNASLWFGVRTRVQLIGLNKIHPFQDIKSVIALFLPSVAIQVYTVLDKTMIGIITRDSYDNGYYEQAYKIVRLVLMLVTAIGPVMLSRNGFYFKQKQRNLMEKSIYDVYAFISLLGFPLCLGLISISDIIVPWFLGAEFKEVIRLLKIMPLLIPVIGFSNVTGMQYLIPTKQDRVFSTSVIVGACVNIILNLLLIVRLGAFGATIASVIAEIVVTSTQLIAVRHQLKLKKIMLIGLKYLLYSSVMAIVVWALARRLIPSARSTVLLIIVGALVYFCILYFIARDRFFVMWTKDSFTRLRNRIKEKNE